MNHGVNDEVRGFQQLPATVDSSSPQSVFSRLHPGVDFSPVVYGWAVNHAAQKLLTRCDQDVEILHNKFDAMSNQGEATSFLVECLRSLRKTLRLCIDRLHHQQLFGSQKMKDHHYTCKSPVTSIQNWRSNEYKVLACSANVLIPFTSQLKLPVDYYESTQDVLGEFMSSIFGNNIEADILPYHANNEPLLWPRRPFPACHIAYLNMDRDLALELWTRNLNMSTDSDLLGRSFVQLVAEAGDFDLLWRMTDSLPKDNKFDTWAFLHLNPVMTNESALMVEKILDEHLMSRVCPRAVHDGICMLRPENGSNCSLQYLRLNRPDGLHELEALVSPAERSRTSCLETCSRSFYTRQRPIPQHQQGPTHLDTLKVPPTDQRSMSFCGTQAFSHATCEDFQDKMLHPTGYFDCIDPGRVPGSKQGPADVNIFSLSSGPQLVASSDSSMGFDLNGYQYDDPLACYDINNGMHLSFQT